MNLCFVGSDHHQRPQLRVGEVVETSQFRQVGDIQQLQEWEVEDRYFSFDSIPVQPHDCEVFHPQQGLQRLYVVLFQIQLLDVGELSEDGDILDTVLPEIEGGDGLLSFDVVQEADVGDPLGSQLEVPAVGQIVLIHILGDLSLDQSGFDLVLSLDNVDN